ncbi:MAG: DNA glycosylase AlkZ-like family protein [Actinomycetota bacterium]
MQEVLEQARWWSWRRQRLDRSCRNIDDALRSVVAVPATHPWGPLALLARVPRLTPGHAADTTTVQVGFRTRAIKNIPYLMPFDAAHMSVPLGTMVPAVRRARKGGRVSADTYKTTAAKIERVTTDAPLPRGEVAEILRVRSNLGPIIDRMVAEGRLTEVAPVSALEDSWSVVETTAWVGDPEPIEPEEALIRLADGYLAAYGPATLGDFAEWTGVNETDARMAFGALKIVDVGGGLMLHERDARGFDGLRPWRNRVTLLPRGDSWLMAYDDSLPRFGTPRTLYEAFDSRGFCEPTILVDSEIAGIWKLTVRKNSARIELGMLRRLDERQTALLGDELRLVEDFLRSAGLHLEVDPLPKPKA